MNAHMEKIVFLGTGSASVTQCYNTCFTIKMGDEHFLVDAGGGNGIVSQLQKAQIPISSIHHLFISHQHTDHLLGAIWIVRFIGQQMYQGKYQGTLNIYTPESVAAVLQTICNLTLDKNILALFGEKIVLKCLKHNDSYEILGNKIAFFDIHSNKIVQFGFTMQDKRGRRLTFLGDEPYREQERAYAEGADWLIHEAFCLYSQREKFKPYEKNHATVKEACTAGEQLRVKNLILVHTEDHNLTKRKELYTVEGSTFYSGRLLIPDDLESVDL